MPLVSLDRCKYAAVEDLWIVCCHFNAADFKSMPKHFREFAGSLKDARLNFIAVECAFDGKPFCLEPDGNTIQVRSNSVLWQKERLLNLAISKLPASCTKVAWVDADVVFLNGQWAAAASNLLNDYKAVQLFERFTQLVPCARDYFRAGRSMDSFGYRYTEKRDSFDPNFYHIHGHAGQGWAFRREIIDKHGFYDRCIVGSADHLSAHAMIGNFSSDCFTPDLGNNPVEIECFREWAVPFYEDVRGEISYVPGTLLHKWHGTLKDRQHEHRHQRLADCGYDPRADLRLNEDGCWEWNTDKPELHALLREYFKSRKEDGSGSWSV